MIVLEVKDYYSADVDQVWLWKPQREQPIYYHLAISIGMVRDDRSDDFQVIIATPEGLAARTEGENVLSDRNLIVLREYSWQAVEASLEPILERCAAASWHESVIRLQRYFLWEYEDFVREE